jgi:hypothetical protein
MQDSEKLLGTICCVEITTRPADFLLSLTSRANLACCRPAQVPEICVTSDLAVPVNFKKESLIQCPNLGCQLPVLCELPFVEMRKLVWIPCCLLTWVRTRIPSDMTHVAHLVANSVLISWTSFLMATSFITSGGPITCLPCSMSDLTFLSGPGQLWGISSVTSRKAVPTDWSGSSIGRGFLMSLVGWTMTAAVPLHILCLSSCLKVRAPDLWDLSVGIRRAASVGKT